MMHQVGEQPVFERGQLHGHAGDGEPRQLGVEPQGAAFDLAARMASAPAQQGTHARHDFLDMERLHHIIVGTGIDPGHLVSPAVAGGQDDDRRLDPGTVTPSALGRPMSRMMAS